jgi:hypothetical protein
MVLVLVIVLEETASSTSTAIAEYEYEYDKSWENIDWESARLEQRNVKTSARRFFHFGSATKQTQTTRHEHRRNATLKRFSIEHLPEHERQPKHHDAPQVSDEGWLISMNQLLRFGEHSC